MTETTRLPRRRGLLAIPGSVLLICLFLPALKVCGTPEYPISFPPVYAAYLGGIGMLIMALGARRRVLAAGAAITPALAFATGAMIAVGSLGANGGLFKICALVLALTSLVGLVAMVRWIVRSTPTSRAMALIVIGQGLMSTLWATLLAFDTDGMWGAHVTLVAGLATIIGGIAWFRTTIIAPVRLPQATAVRIGEPV